MSAIASHIPEQLGILIRSQDGVASAAQIGRCGLTADTLSRMVRRGLLTRITQGAYTLPEIWEEAGPWRRYELLVRAVGARAPARDGRLPAISHVSAAVLWGLPMLTVPRLVHTVSTTRAAGRKGVVFRHREDGEMDVLVLGDMIVTTKARTVADCCAMLPFADAVVLADAALSADARARGARRDSIGPLQEEHRSLLLETARRKNYAVARARAALAFADGRSESVAESRTRVIMHQLGLPAPRLQFRIDTARGTYYPDFALPEWGVLIEVDGAVKVLAPYGGDALRAVEKERRRHIHLQEEGWEIARLTWEDLRSPATVRDKILSAAARARRRGIAPALVRRSPDFRGSTHLFGGATAKKG